MQLSIPQSVRYGPDEQYSDKINFNIQREPGSGDMAGLNILFKYKSGKVVVVRKDELINELETKPYSENLGQLSPDDSSDIIKEISVTPILKTSKGKEFFGELLTDYRYEGVDYRLSNKINFGNWKDYANSLSFPLQAVGGGNKIIENIGPYGNKVFMWEATTSGGFEAKDIAVNKGETYRFSVWINNKDSTYGKTTFSLVQRSFCSLNLPSGKWYLFVGYLYANNMQTQASSNSGIYDPDKGIKVEGMGCNPFNHEGSGNYYYTSYKISFSEEADKVQYFYAPRVDVVDGKEPSIGDLLNPYR